MRIMSGEAIFVYFLFMNFIAAEAVTQALLSQKFAKVLDLRENHISVGACRRIAEVLQERVKMVNHHL